MSERAVITPVPFPRTSGKEVTEEEKPIAISSTGSSPKEVLPFLPQEVKSKTTTWTKTAKKGIRFIIRLKIIRVTIR